MNRDERFFQLVTEAMYCICRSPKYGALRNLGRMTQQEEEELAFELASKAIEMALERFAKEKRLAEAYGYKEIIPAVDPLDDHTW